MNMTPECVAMRLKRRIAARPNLFGSSPLISTIRQVAQLLLHDGAEGDKIDDQRLLDYSFALCDAVAYNMSPRKVFGLLKYVDDKVEEGSSPFTNPLSGHMPAAASAVGSMEKLQELFSSGVNLNLRSDYFGHSLQNAAMIGREDMVSLLLKRSKKAEVPHESLEYPGEAAIATALDAACIIGQKRVVQLMLDFPRLSNWQADTEAGRGNEPIEPVPLPLSPHYEHAIVTSVRNGHADLACLLLKRLGITSYNKSDRNLKNLMDRVLFNASSRGYLHVVQMLLDSFGVDANARNHEDQNALHHAARGGHVRVVRLLLDRGAKYCVGPYGDPLYLATRNGHEAVAQLLLDYGADVNAKGRDYSVLARAARNGECHMIRFLIEKGVDLQAPGCGDIAIELAAEKGHVDTVRLLVGLGVDVDGSTDRGSPMLWAMMYGHDNVVEALMELGAKTVDPEAFVAWMADKG